MNGKKNSYIALTMVGRLALTTLVINLLLLFVVGSMSKKGMEGKETDYLEEIVSNISNSIASTMHEYVAVAEMLALNDNIIRILDASDQSQPMHTQSNVNTVVKDLASVQHHFPDILNVAVMDIDQDGYLLHNGGYSNESFSFQAREYYATVQEKKSMVTTPYMDVESGGLVVSTAAPVFNASQQVVGAVVVDLTVAFIGDLVASSHFGETGSSIMIDGNGTIIGHEDTSNIGQNYAVLHLGGEELQSQFTNPTKTIIEFTLDSEKRTGEVGQVGNLDWILITSVSSEEFHRESNEILATLLGMLVVSFGFSIVVVIITVLSSLRPLNDIKLAMSELASGNLHHHLDYESNNEIGKLADDIRYTMENLAEYIDEIQRLLSSCGEGDFTVTTEMEFLGDFAHIQHSIQDFIQLISSTLGGIKATVEQVTIGSDYVATGSQNLAEGSLRQSDSVSELNEHISGIAEQVKLNVETVKVVNETSKEMQQGLLSGNQRMEDMVASMDEIARCSEGIQKIVKTIEDVAFQTNILALNAAVEAARAGSSGRGFAVVADEVRKLSIRTSMAVQETTTLIGETVCAVNTGTDIVDSTAKGLRDVITGLDSFMSSLESITSASQEQAVAIDAIYQDVTEITSVMQTNSAISEESAATSEELSSQASVMQETILQFKTKDE